jgi:hypothetical protein
MTTLTQYLVPCLTENINVFTDYRTSPPTVCPNNNTHIINPDGIMAISSTSLKSVKINQNSQLITGGYYRTDYYHIDVPAGTGMTASYDIVYPYNIAAYSTTFLVTSDNVGDGFNVVSYPDTVCGQITQTLATGSTGLYLPTTSTGFLNPAFIIKISDGINTEELGEIISVDNNTGFVVYSTPNVNNYGVGAMISFTVPRINNGKFVTLQNMGLGFSVVSSSGLAAGKAVRVTYINSTNVAKTLSFLIELQY